jgi:hypothetical protein
MGKVSRRLVTTLLLLAGAGCSSERLEAGGPEARPIVQVAYASSGDVVVFSQREVVVYDGALLQEKVRFPYRDVPDWAELGTAVLSSDGSVAAVTWYIPISTPPGQSTMTLGMNVDAIRMSDGRRLARLSVADRPRTLRVSPRGGLLSVECFSSGTKTYAVDGGTLLWSSDKVESPAAFSADETVLYAAFSHGTVGSALAEWAMTALDARTGQPGPPMFGVGYGYALSGDGRRLVENDAGTIKLWDTTSGELTSSFDILPDRQDGTSVWVSHDGSRIASLAARLSSGDLRGWEVHVWTSAGELLLNVLTDKSSVQALSPDGTELAVAPLRSLLGQDSLSIFRVSDGAEIVRRPLADIVPR